MRVLRAYDFNRNDCTMDLQCEHCLHEVKVTSAYNDEFYRVKVVPTRHCPKCGKNSAGNIMPRDTAAL